DRVSVNAFLAAKGALAIGGLVFGALVGLPSGAGMGFLLTLGGAFVGFVLPDFVLSAKARGRREQVRSELPDALDLLAVSVEAGLGFDAAIQKLTEHMDGPLVEEFALSLSEMRIGETRQHALEKMVQRVQAPELASFVR